MNNRARNSLASMIVVVLISVACSSTTAQKTAPAAPAQAETAPAPLPAPAAAAVPEKQISYTVVRGDHLWGIASKAAVYGDPYQWPLIYSSNRTKIDDPDLIYPGQVFTIQKNPTRAQIQAAVRHARTRGSWTPGAIEKSDRAYLAAYVAQ